MIWRGSLSACYPLPPSPCPEAGVLYALESLTALNSTEATERGAPFSAFSALSGISGSFIRALRAQGWRFCRL